MLRALFASKLGVYEWLFVYGSLKRGLMHHDELRAAQFVGEACLRGFRLVLYEDSYPALVASPDADAPVRGEVYALSPDDLSRLDVFEECPQLYQRVRVRLEDGSFPWAYVIPQETGERYPPIRGEWEGLYAGLSDR